MAFPTIVSSSGMQSSGTTSPHSAAIPSPCNSGNLIVILVAIPNSTSISTPTGFSQVYEGSVLSGHRFAVFKKISDGTEGGTNVSFTGGAIRSHNAVYVLGNISGAVEISTATAYSEFPNPPSITPTWTVDTLYLAFCSDLYGISNPSAAPSGYSGYSELESGSAIDSAVAYKTGSGTEDPGTFTAGAAASWMAATIAIKSATAANNLFFGSNF